MLGIIVSAISLAVIFYITDLQRFVEAIRLADYRLIILGIGISLLWLVIRGVVWRTLLQEKVPYSPIFWTMNEGYLLNNLLPFRLGEVGRALLLSAKTILHFWEVLSSIIIERGLDMAMAVGLLFITLPFVVGAGWANQAAIGVGVSILLLFLSLYLLAQNRDWAQKVFTDFRVKWPFMLRLGGSAIPSFLDGLAVLTDMGRFLRAIGWMILNWGVSILQYYVIMAAFISDPVILWAAFCLAVSALGIAAPSSPGAVGVLELSIVGALSLFGLDPAVSLAYALTLHFIQILTTGTLGIYALVNDGESLRGLYYRLRQLPKDEVDERD